jgi:hypothetical protein
VDGIGGLFRLAGPASLGRMLSKFAHIAPMFARDKVIVRSHPTLVFPHAVGCGVDAGRRVNGDRRLADRFRFARA